MIKANTRVNAKVIDESDIESKIEQKSLNHSYPNAIPLDIKYYDEPYNAVRRCKLIMFAECLGNNKLYKQELEHAVFNDEQMTDLFKKDIIKYLERGCLNRAIKMAKKHNIRGVWSDNKFVNLYHCICYKTAINIDKKSSVSSDYILKKICNKEVNPKDVANMTSKELCPKKYEKIDTKLNKRTNIEIKTKFSNLYQCKKCKRKQTITERRYNRSLDEGVNLTIRCLFCGNSWGG